MSSRLISFGRAAVSDSNGLLSLLGIPLPSDPYTDGLLLTVGNLFTVFENITVNAPAISSSLSSSLTIPKIASNNLPAEKRVSE